MAFSQTEFSRNPQLVAGQLPSDAKSHKPISIVVIGAGVAGCFSALELADVKTQEGTPKYEIILLDKNPQVLQGSSNITPGRMGLGYHYIHLPTAFMYLKATIEFQKKFSKIKDFTIGSDLPENSPLRHALQHGRYFITKDSNPKKEEVLAAYEAIKNEYARLVEEDPTNKVFGEPKDFYRRLKPEEYQGYVKTSKVDVGIETAERLLNWPEFRKYIISELETRENIKIVPNAKVESITVTKTTVDGEVEYNQQIKVLKDNGVEKRSKVYIADSSVNCTWEHVDQLNATAGIKSKEVRTNRLKAIVIFKLPEKLINQPSAFFCMGAHAMFSNLGYNKNLGYHTGAMTFAPKTSMDQSTDLNVPEAIKKYLDGKATLDEKTIKAEQIRRGVAKYLKGIDPLKGLDGEIVFSSKNDDDKVPQDEREPDIEPVELIDVRYGIVQTLGTVDIFDHKSEFSRRDYNGVKPTFLGVSNACMKLLYGPENGELTRDLIQEYVSELSSFTRFVASSEKKATNEKVTLDKKLALDEKATPGKLPAGSDDKIAAPKSNNEAIAAEQGELAMLATAIHRPALKKQITFFNKTTLKLTPAPTVFKHSSEIGRVIPTISKKISHAPISGSTEVKENDDRRESDAGTGICFGMFWKKRPDSTERKQIRSPERKSPSMQSAQ